MENGLDWPRFLDWALPDWTRRYPGELDRCIRLMGRAEERPLPMTLELDGTDPAFRPEDVAIVPAAGRFVLPPELARSTDPAFAALSATLGATRLFDGTVARVAALDRPPGGGAVLRWGDTGYFDGVRTHLLLDWRENGGTTLRDALHGQGRLPSFADSRQANTFGMSILLITADQRLILQRRSHRVMVWPGTWGPSAAGMVDPGDLRAARTLADLWPYREVAEELGLEAEALHAAPHAFLGLGRELARGGMPELFFLGLLPVTAEAVLQASATAHDQDEFSRLAFFDLAGLESPALRAADAESRLAHRIDEFMVAFGAEASAPLLAGVALWARYRLRRAPA